MKTPQLVQNVLFIWETLTASTHLNPIEITLELSHRFRINPIPITLIGQQSSNESVREDAIHAYYALMEEDLVRKSIELSISG